MDERIITNEKLNEDIDSNIRPNSIDEYIGQTEVKKFKYIYKSSKIKKRITRSCIIVRAPRTWKNNSCFNNCK